MLCNGDDILWVLGHRINNQFRVTEHTKDIIRIDIQIQDKSVQIKADVGQVSNVAINAKKLSQIKKLFPRKS